MGPTRRRAVFPGSFDPLTVAHLAIIDAVLDQCDVDVVELVFSRLTLGKERAGQRAAEERASDAARLIGDRPVRLTVTDAQLVADIAEGSDLVVVGADKWAQMIDPHFYDDDPLACDEAIARLPHVVIVPRPPHAVPDDVTVLRVPPTIAGVSSTAVRAGRDDWAATAG